RSLRVVRMNPVDPDAKVKLGTVVATGHGLVLVAESSTEWLDGTRTVFWHGIQFSDGGAFDAVPDWTLRPDGQTVVPTWPGGALERIVKLLETGPAAGDPEAAARFA